MTVLACSASTTSARPEAMRRPFPCRVHRRLRVDTMTMIAREIAAVQASARPVWRVKHSGRQHGTTRSGRSAALAPRQRPGRHGVLEAAGSGTKVRQARRGSRCGRSTGSPGAARRILLARVLVAAAVAACTGGQQQGQAACGRLQQHALATCQLKQATTCAAMTTMLPALFRPTPATVMRLFGRF